ncbi:xylulokinase [Lacticaseibacillus kribbianus]|uniref:xylulokinase n=1 Tax=Lacticaseibacillus kribbianus TaxID=2926292 RepID=UPI001CD62262|nr:xylulokinase [Lacticaseibacillus kribbianus]
MEYVIGVDLGTSAVKVLLVTRDGAVVATGSRPYPLSQPQPGYNEQNPDHWVEATAGAIKDVLRQSGVAAADVKGLSYSGQMHGLVLLNAAGRPLRPAILWNDTRTTKQSEEIMATMGQTFVDITRNRPLEGFTLPKLLWVKENEPEIFAQATTFLLPKDYLRYKMTGQIQMELSDAAGTVMLDVAAGRWSSAVLAVFDLPESLCPPLIQATDQAGTLTATFAAAVGLEPGLPVFGGGADNACGAIGAGITNPDQGMCSIGTSGVVLGYEPDATHDYHGDLHFFNHAIPGAYYSMGVTLAAGYSLSWLKKTFAPDDDFDDFMQATLDTSIGANGLLFTPYIVGERTPYADAAIRGSFIGVDSRQDKGDFIRAVMEGVTFSFKDILALYEANGKTFTKLTSIGGGAHSPLWLQIQADVFDKPVVCLQSEQGPGLGAAMIAAVGLGWFKDFADCAKTFVHERETYLPNPAHVAKYAKLYKLYQQVYPQTKALSKALAEFRA